MRQGIVSLIIVLTIITVFLGGCKSPEISNRGLAPPSYYVSNIDKGDYSENPLYIYNAHDYEATYEIAYKYPDNIDIEKGYGYPPLPAKDWVTMNGEYLNTQVVIPANTQVEVSVRLEIPENTLVDVDKWVFWISVIETGQGMIQYGAAQKWHITMME